MFRGAKRRSVLNIIRIAIIESESISNNNNLHYFKHWTLLNHSQSRICSCHESNVYRKFHKNPCDRYEFHGSICSYTKATATASTAFRTRAWSTIIGRIPLDFCYFVCFHKPLMWRCRAGTMLERFAVWRFAHVCFIFHVFSLNHLFVFLLFVQPKCN